MGWFQSSLAIILLAGCPSGSLPTPESLGQPGLDPATHYESTPRLPSPFAGSYARVPTTPTDAVVAGLVRGLRWDASLAGAAASIALSSVEGQRGLTRWELREALWMAGYPYGIREARIWSVPASGPPPTDLVQWLNNQTQEVDIGVVRARANLGDIWVALSARPKHDLGVIAREVDVGASVVFPAVPGAHFTVADANGRLHTKDLSVPRSVLLSVSGEWLFEVRRGETLIADFPVYAGMSAPTKALLSIPNLGEVRDETDMVFRTEKLMSHVRTQYGVLPWRRNPLLDAAARALVRGETDANEVIASVGLQPGSAVAWRCTAPTTEDCLDKWIWNPHRRDVLLSSVMDAVGYAAILTTEGITLVAVITRE